MEHFLIFIAYFLPSIIALCRKHHNLAGLIVLNLLTGWTVVGWIWSLVWSLMNPPVTAGPVNVVVNNNK